MDHQTASVVQTVRGSVRGGGSALSSLHESTLVKLKQQALESARRLQQQVPISCTCTPLVSTSSMMLAGWAPYCCPAVSVEHNLVTQAVQTATESAAVARDVAASRSTREAGTKLWLAGRKLSDSSFAAVLARTLVCAYFLNLCIDDLETWR